MNELNPSFKICNNIEEIEWQENKMCVIDVDEKKIILAKHGDKIMACNQLCPHAGVPLNDGYVDAMGNIVCPKHLYKFSLKNGFNVSGEGYCLKTHIIDVKDDGVFVTLK